MSLFSTGRTALPMCMHFRNWCPICPICPMETLPPKTVFSEAITKKSIQKWYPPRLGFPFQVVLPCQSESALQQIHNHNNAKSQHSRGKLLNYQPRCGQATYRASPDPEYTRLVKYFIFSHPQRSSSVTANCLTSTPKFNTGAMHARSHTFVYLSTNSTFAPICETAYLARRHRHVLMRLARNDCIEPDANRFHIRNTLSYSQVRVVRELPYVASVDYSGTA